MAIFGKLAYAAGVSPGALLLLRFSVAAVLLGLLLALRPGLRATSAVSASPAGTSRVRVVVTALGLGAVGYATQATLYFSALQRIDASLVALVLYTYPALVTIAAAVTYTGYILVADTAVHRLSPVVLAALVMTGASAALAVRSIATGGIDVRFGSVGWVWIACIAVMSTVMAMLAFFAGLRRTGPSTAAILSTFEPVVTTALAALTLNEFLTPVQLVGGLIVLSSVAVLQLRPPRRPAASPPEPDAALPVGCSPSATTIPSGPGR